MKSFLKIFCAFAISFGNIFIAMQPSGDCQSVLGEAHSKYFYLYCDWVAVIISVISLFVILLLLKKYYLGEVWEKVVALCIVLLGSLPLLYFIVTKGLLLIANFK